MSSLSGSRDHYVPRFLLKNFGNILYVFDKEKNQSFRATYKNSPAWETGIETDDTSEYLRRIDADSSAAISRLNHTGNPTSITEVQRWYIAHFAAVQMVRTKKFRDSLEQMIVKAPTRDTTVGEEVPSKVESLANESSRQLANEAQAGHILRHAPRYAAILYEMAWVCLPNRRPGNPLWTSDNPVVAYDNLYSSRYSPGLFLGTPGIQVFFPISPNLLLMMLMRGYYKAAPIRPMKDKMQVWKANAIQLAGANRFIFSSNNPTKLARYIISEKQKEDANLQRRGKL